jgi:hypothetical protein
LRQAKLGDGGWVVVGPDAVSARIAHSYFLVADGAGNVLASTPRLTRLY